MTVYNAKIKEFPEALLGEFFAGQSVSIPEGQRKGFQRGGRAQNNILRNLGDLPAESSVRWKADTLTVKFTLKIER